MQVKILSVHFTWINVEQQRGAERNLRSEKRHILYSKLNIVRAVCVEHVADMRNAQSTEDLKPQVKRSLVVCVCRY
jgi:hypothetical protein